MKALTIPLRLIMILGLTFSYEANASRNDELASCSGTIAGNATYEISMGNDESAKQILNLAYRPYLEFIFHQALPREEMLILNRITASSGDAVTNRINSNVYGNDDYELYVKCLTKLGNLAIEVRDTSSEEREFAQKASSQTIERLFRLIKAGN